MSDRWAVAVAVAVVAGAVWAGPVPLAAGAVLSAAAFAVRQPVLLVAGGLLLAAALGARAEAGLDPPAPGPLDATVTLVGDPDVVAGATRVDVRWRERRLEAWARGGAAAALGGRLAGERVRLVGHVAPAPPERAGWLARRHVVGRLAVERVGAWSPGDPASRLANTLRRTLARGAEALGPERRSLFLGVVLGDRRGQPPELTADFRGSGLAHLLAVSGQNVAFVLALTGPVLARLRLGWRWVATLGVIALFALVTRFEPSVLRASAMAGLAATAGALGRRATPLRLLALAVAGMVLVDPFLARELAFRLSVGASLGIVALAGPITRRLPGPRPLADAVAVTAAAQVGVAPVLVPAFGGVPLASLPANLLAGPVAGPAMMWGLPAGLLAGVAGPPLSGLLHLPTGWAVGWVAAVARAGATWPLGEVTTAHLLALGALAVAAVALRRWPPAVRHAFAGAAAGVLLLPVAAAVRGPELAAGVAVAPGARLWRAGATVLVLDTPPPDALLHGLRRRNVDHLDLVVARRRGRRAGAALAPLLRRFEVDAVVAPRGHGWADAGTPEPGTELRAGRVVVAVDTVAPALAVSVRVAPSGARDPPR